MKVKPTLHSNIKDFTAFNNSNKLKFLNAFKTFVNDLTSLQSRDSRGTLMWFILNYVKWFCIVLIEIRQEVWLFPYS